MTWNERVVRTEHPDQEITYGVHEAFYHKPSDTIPHSITTTPVSPYGGTLEELAKVIERYKQACSQPVLILRNDKVEEYTD